ncbi:hypothetical protein C0J52_06336 [Blattella germanica]|nr:hypothetical protein C0J52_06336 [Blattella germanica]
MSSILISASFMFIGYLIAHPSRDFLYSKDWWGMACVFFCHMMTSGQMWNSIHFVPMMSIGHFLDSEAQCILESCIIALICILLKKVNKHKMEAMFKSSSVQLAYLFSEIINPL